MYDDSRLFSLDVTDAYNIGNDKSYSFASFQVPTFVKKQADTAAVYVSIVNASIPSSWYVLNASNNILDFSVSDSGGPPIDYQILVRELGTYNANQLVSLLNTYLNTLGLDDLFTFIYDIINNRIGITWTNYSGPAGSTIAFATTTTMSYLVGLVLTQNTPNDLFITDVTPTYEFTNQCNLTGVNLYLIQCDQLAVQNYSLQLGGNMIGSIQNAAGLWQLTLWQNYNNLRFRIPNKAVDELTIKIYDERGVLINFNGQPWSMTLRVTYEKTTQLPTHDLTQYVDQHNSGKMES